MPENFEDLAISIINKRFAYCGTEHPLLLALHKKALSAALESESGAFGHGGLLRGRPKAASPLPPVALPPLPDESALEEVRQVDPMELIKQDNQLPPLPAVLYELQRVVQNELSNNEAVAEVVRSDAGLSTFLLRLVNSAFYSFPARVDTVSRAVSMVGTRPLYMLSMGLLFQDLVNAVPRQSLSITNFWSHSILVGLTAQRLWGEMGHQEDERLFTAGLLHDVGKLALACLLPKSDVYYQHLQVKSREKPCFEVERELLGFDHSRFGGMLLRKWNMPASLSMPVLWHHQPQAAPHYKEPMVVHLADIIATALGVCPMPGGVVPKLDERSWESLGLSVEKALDITDQALFRLQDVCELFSVQAKK